ncbi:hypothetical protein Trisim1_002923 [Trichoderma cf. simile WF8]|uniref:HFB protein n=2 Tax=Trichoderma TaxID=5543 RepID=A0A9P4XDP1_9HYPO|nr:hypothetical protein CFAM422_007320 [Trichoderma lentiforme]OPB42612.1 HFBs protein [Trichoderma guizhouense]
MKTSAIIVAVTAALVSAQAPPEGTNKVTCAKPNANYCYGGDIIVRCDANGVGTAGRCSDNVAGYPPLGGVAECWQSTETSGDAACQKNCVVYAQPSSFTLAASQCTPSFTASATSAPATTLSSAVATGTASASVIYTTVVNGTVTTTVPCTTLPGTPTTTPAGPPVVITTTPAGPVGTGVPPPPPANNGTAPTGPSGTNTPVGPTSTGPSTIPTGAAVANRASGALAIMGLVAAAFL